MELAQRVAMKVGDKLHGLAIAQDLVPYDTGALSRSHVVVAEGSVNRAKLIVGRPYVRHVFYGIRGIKPVKGKALAFKKPKNWRGKVGKSGKVFLRSVGPRAPRPWLLTAIARMKAGGFGFVADYLKRQAILELQKK